MADGDKESNYLDMSDDDFIKINSPVVDQSQKETSETTSTVEEPIKEEKEEVTETQNNSEDNKDDKQPEKVVNDPDKDKKTDPEDKTTPESEWKEYQNDPEKTPEENADLKADHDKTKPAPKDKEQVKVDPVGSKDEPAKADTNGNTPAKTMTSDEFMAAVMKPIKANGKEIKLNTPDEAIRLIQMGAGYAKKLQQIQPALKTVRMLEKHDLVDPNKISFLIDLQEGNPEAIRKLLKDKGIDPLDLNTTDDVTYRPINRAVSDQELSFHDALNDLQSHPEGKATIKEINETWDTTSKNVIFSKPELLKVIQDQKDTGIYSQITTEIDRQKLLGHIPQNTPFLESYKIAGDFLVANNQLQAPSNPTAKPAAPVAQVQPQPTVLGVTVEPAKVEASNSDKAKAAASPSSPIGKKAAPIVNYLDMPDDQFMKQLEGRL